MISNDEQWQAIMMSNDGQWRCATMNNNELQAIIGNNEKWQAIMNNVPWWAMITVIINEQWIMSTDPAPAACAESHFILVIASFLSNSIKDRAKHDRINDQKH